MANQNPETTAEQQSHAVADFGIDHVQQSAKQQLKAYLGRFKSGQDLGLAPALLALAILTAVFWIRSPFFLTRFNFGNYWQQAAPICMLAMGVTFVLLVGEIDLGAGYTAGVCAAVLALRLKGGTPLIVAILLALLVAILIGALNGWLVARVGIPSFIVTLSGFLGWQGVLLLLSKEGGTIRVQDKTIVAIENSNLSVALGWALWAVVTIGFAAIALSRASARRRGGLSGEALGAVVGKVTGVGVVFGLAVWQLNEPRGANGLRGVPVAVPIIIAIAGVLTFFLSRTSWGRHLYAVGGNAEAARRAGINVMRIKMSAFIVCSMLACIAGFILASRLNSVAPDTGGNDTLLIAVGAAVIGGTSLFGGRGRIVNAIIGGLVFAMINNGLPLLGILGPFNFSDAGLKFVVNGLVLLGFASIDALSRKRSATT
jgi:D-xylose transport system permease protein